VGVTLPAAGSGQNGIALVVLPANWTLSDLSGVALGCQLDAAQIGHCLVPLAQFGNGKQPTLTVTVTSSAPNPGDALLCWYVASRVSQRQLIPLS
jgi:hypothetical protein